MIVLTVLSSPYPLREGQGDLVEFVDDTFSSGRTCMAHAPTGIGKTLAALLGALPHLPDEGKLLYAVNRKNQIPIILKELKRINESNGTDFKATAFASKSELCRDPDMKKLGYRELLEACELRRKNWACPYYNALFEGTGQGQPSLGTSSLGTRGARPKSRVALELASRVLDEMPSPHLIEGIAKEVEGEIGASPVCIYELLKHTAKDSQVLVGTFWYSFHPVVAPSHLQGLGVDRKNCVLICDEAHNLPRFCREALSTGMSSTRITYASRELSRYSTNLEEQGISPAGIESFLSGFSGLYRRFKFTPEGKHLPMGLVRAFLRKAGITSFKGPVESLESAGALVLESRVPCHPCFLRPFLPAVRGTFLRTPLRAHQDDEGRSCEKA
jgi:Rad3-related DNA helicase